MAKGVTVVGMSATVGVRFGTKNLSLLAYR